MMKNFEKPKEIEKSEKMSAIENEEQIIYTNTSFVFGEI